MQVKCSVINDLLVLYVDDLCCDDTKEIIETHLSTCSECKQKLERMQIPVWHENEEKLIVNKSFDEKKVMKKLKKRTNMIVIGILVLIPLLVLCINQKTGRGVSFSSLPQIVKSHQFLSAIERGDYSKAYSFIGIESIYNDYVAPENADYLSFLYLQYNEIQIGNDIYYVNEDIYADYYQQYLEDGDEVNFWYQVFMYIEDNYVMWAGLPKDKMDEVIKAHPKIENLVSQDYEIEVGADKTYIIHHPFSVGYVATCEAPIISEYYYEHDFKNSVEAKKEWAASKKKDFDYYSNLGFDTYNDESQQLFEENLLHLANQEIYLKNHKLVSIERIFDEVILTYSLTVNQNHQEIKGIYINLIWMSDGIVEWHFYENSDSGLSNDFSLIRLKAQDDIE